MAVKQPAGEARVEDESRITLPSEIVRALGWEPGDTLLLHRVGGTILLMREPVSWADTFSGRMGHVWGDHQDTLRYLDEERASWEQSENHER